MRAFFEADQAYTDRRRWNKWRLTNIAMAGHFKAAIARFPICERNLEDKIKSYRLSTCLLRRVYYAKARMHSDVAGRRARQPIERADQKYCQSRL